MGIDGDRAEKRLMYLSRSDQMARIRGSHTTPERLLSRALWRTGLRYRLHYPAVLGKPDIVFPRERVAVFVDGCFWHGCPDHYVRPRSREDFWARKLAGNVARDCRQTAELAARGWRVCRFWEHMVFEDLDGAIDEVKVALLDKTWRINKRWCVLKVDSLGGIPEQERWHLRRLDISGINRVVVRTRSTRKWRRPAVSRRLSRPRGGEPGS